MANINFPNDPTENQIFTVNGKSYKWDGVKWVAKTTVDKSDVGLGNVQNFSLADEAEAKAGSVSNKYMTPLRTAQAITQLSPAPTIATTEQAETGEDDTVFMTPLKTAQAIAELSPPTDVSTEFAAGVIETNNSNQLSFWQGTQAEYTAEGTILPPTPISGTPLNLQVTSGDYLTDIDVETIFTSTDIFYDGILISSRGIMQNLWQVGYDPNFDAIVIFYLTGSSFDGNPKNYPDSGFTNNAYIEISGGNKPNIVVLDFTSDNIPSYNIEISQYDPNTLYLIEEE